MPSPQKSPAICTIAPNDAGARLGHLQDLIAEAAGERRGGLLTDYHEAVAAGAMHAVEGDGVILVTILTRDGQSHIYALPGRIARHLREQLIELRQSPAYLVSRAAQEKSRANGRVA